MNRRLVSTLLAIVFSTLGFGADLEEARNPYIIVTKKAQKAAELELRLAARGKKPKAKLAAINGLAVDLTAQEVAEVISTGGDDVEIHPDYAVGAHATPMPAITAVGTANFRALGLTGKGIGVAVLDSGVRNREDIKARTVYSQDFTGGGKPADDLYGHGTHVAGLIGGNGASTPAYVGVAPEVTFVNLQVLDKNGVGRDSWVIAAIDRAIALRTTYNIRVMNLSLGRPVFGSFANDLLCQAVKRAWEAGIVVVVAAGNHGRFSATNGYATIGVPGNSPYVITVGALNSKSDTTRADDVVASYSSKGPTLIDQIVKPDLVAPGNLLISLTHATATVANTYPTIKIDSSYAKLSGTSMAAGVVSGVAALMLQRDPTLTPNLIKARLMKTATKTFPAPTVTGVDALSNASYTIHHDLFTVGAGALNVDLALSNTERGTGVALSPRVQRNASGVVLNTQTVAGINVLWGDSTFVPSGVWGSNVIWGSNVVWGSNVIWGSSATQGYNVIWGSTSPWGSNVVWGDSTLDVLSLNALIYGEK